MSAAVPVLLARLWGLVRGEAEGVATDPGGELGPLLESIRRVLESVAPVPPWLKEQEHALEDLEDPADPPEALARAYRLAWRLLGAVEPDRLTLIKPSGELAAGARWALLVALSRVEVSEVAARLDELPAQALAGQSRDPVVRALCRLVETRGADPRGRYGERLARGAYRLDANHRHALEQAAEVPLGLVRLVVEEVHSRSAGSVEALSWLQMLLELVEDPILRLEHGDRAEVLSARIRLYEADHLSRLGQWEPAVTLAGQAHRLIHDRSTGDLEIKATAAALKGRFLVEKREARIAGWCYSGACRTAQRLEPGDRHAELVVEWISMLGPGSASSATSPPVDLVAIAEGWPPDFRPELRWRLHVLEAEMRSVEVIQALARPFEGGGLEDLVVERLYPALAESLAPLARLGELASSAAPLVMRYPFEPEAPIQVWQWWARSELVKDPSESVALLTRAAEVALAEGLVRSFLEVLLDLAWARVAQGCLGSELLGTAPFESLLYGRHALRRAFLDLLEATILAPDPGRRREILARLEGGPEALAVLEGRMPDVSSLVH